MPHLLDTDELPEGFPTHRHEAAFWEALGRVVGTYGFLEEVLGKAIFALTGTREYPDTEIDAALEGWFETLRRALSDPLGNLITRYGNAVRDNAKASVPRLDDLVGDLRAASKIRNVICHGSWPPPGQDGKSTPLFVTSKDEIFSGRVDATYLDQVRRHVAELACEVVNTVTNMGVQFPGSRGPGTPLWPA